jgi:hypothetical protein
MLLLSCQGEWAFPGSENRVSVPDACVWRGALAKCLSRCDLHVGVFRACGQAPWPRPRVPSTPRSMPRRTD